jgi:hypothetical protein
LFLPERAAFSIDATARNGKVESAYPGLESPERSGNVGTLKSKVRAGGPNIKLENDYGTIHILPTRGNGGNRQMRDDRAGENSGLYTAR